MKRADSRNPVVTKETVEDAWKIHPCSDEASNVREQGDIRRRRRRRGIGGGRSGRKVRSGDRRRRRIVDRIRLPLERELNVKV
jgi:hypothetical protein